MPKYSVPVADRKLVELVRGTSPKLSGLELDEADLDLVAADEAGDTGGDAAEDSEAAEAEARRQAVEQADQLLREYNGESDEPPTGPGTDEEMARWTEYLEGVLTDAAAERARIQAVFDAEEAAAAGDVQVEEAEPIDFGSWAGDDVNDLLDRVSGAVPINTARRSVADDMFERGLALMGEE